MCDTRVTVGFDCCDARRVSSLASDRTETTGCHFRVGVGAIRNNSSFTESRNKSIHGDSQHKFDRFRSYLYLCGLLDIMQRCRVLNMLCISADVDISRTSTYAAT